MPEQRAIRAGAISRMYHDPQWYPLALDAYDKTEDGSFTFDGVIPYRDVFLQTWSPVPDRAAAGYVIAMMHWWLVTGRASAIRIGVGATPLADEDVEGNNALLAGLPQPFTATFIGEKNDQDGSLYWDEKHPLAPWRDGRVDQLPLEVGFCDPETIMWHFKQCRGFARWPYGQKEIVAVYRSKTAASELEPLPEFARRR